MTAENTRPNEVVQQSILGEYPQLRNGRLSVKTRFQSSDKSRFYNTYLVESSHPGFERFVAKGSAHARFREKELGTEWRALNLLQSHEGPSPALLIPDHVPQTFLLMEYIEGRPAAEVILSKGDRAETFFQTGKEAGRVHSIPAPGFGSLHSDFDDNWVTYFDGKMRERFSDVRGILPDNVVRNLQGIYESHAEVLEEDSPKSPVLVQRDMHFDNFIMKADTGEAALIDFSYAAGGRPLSDLGRLYVQDFYQFPDYKDTFLQGYQQFIPLPENFEVLMKIYTMSTALGMVYMANAVGRTNDIAYPTNILIDLANGTGLITELLQA